MEKRFLKPLAKGNSKTFFVSGTNCINKSGDGGICPFLRPIDAPVNIFFLFQQV